MVHFDDTTSQHTTYQTFSNLYIDSVYSANFYTSGNFGHVYFNDIACEFKSNINTYIDTISRETNTGIKWEVASSNTVLPSFTTTCLDSFPSIASFEHVLPDTVDKSNGVSISFGTVSYCDEIHLYFSDGTARFPAPFNKTGSASTTSFSVSSSDLATLDNSYVTIILSFIKVEFQTHGGKRFKFLRKFNLAHNAILTP